MRVAVVALVLVGLGRRRALVSHLVGDTNGVMRAIAHDARLPA